MGQSPSAFENVSPLDFRYWAEEVAEYLSEDAFTRYKLRVELALVTVLCRRGLCPEAVVTEIASACEAVTTAEVYAEEDKTRHDIRALVNFVQRRVSDTVKPFVHLGATSFDIVDTANAARYRDVMRKEVIPELIGLETVLIRLTEREADTLQIGRTHGQHAVPITFGFALAEYVSRLGECIVQLSSRASLLPGKFSGAVGAYNASSLFFDDPEVFETEVLAELDLLAHDHSTQIVQPEPLIRLLNEIELVGGVMANLARDMRNLQRTEIGEVGEEFRSDQVGSSTMPQKRNPINFENVESLWKALLGRLVTVHLDQLSDHQRDLTNSASGRMVGELIAICFEMAGRLRRTMAKLTVDRVNLTHNLKVSQGGVLAEPMYIILAALGHPDAHETVKQLTLESQRSEKTLAWVFANRPELAEYRERMTEDQRCVLTDPSAYTGIAAGRAREVAAIWHCRMEKIQAELA